MGERAWEIEQRFWNFVFKMAIPEFAIGLFAPWSIKSWAMPALPVAYLLIYPLVHLKGIRRRRVYLSPTTRAIAKATSSDRIKLIIRGEIRATPAHLPSPAEEMLRRFYGTRLEPVLRWLPARLMRVYWWAQKPFQAVGRFVRRPELAKVKVVIKADYLDADKVKAVSSIVHTKVPMGEVNEQVRQIGSKVVIRWTPRRRPPVKVGVERLEAVLPTLAEHEFYLGDDASHKANIVSVDDDSPHISCSAQSGAGKTELAKMFAIQVLARGGYVVILDRKGSHRWARGLARVDYCRTAEQMHEALLRLARMADERNSASFDAPEGYDPGPRFLVVAEELNATFSQLRDYWANHREKGESKVSPAVTAFRELLFMGRAAKVNVFAVAQMLTANTVGGPEARENFGVRCLARYSRNNWQMLVPEAAMPRASRRRGLWQVVVAGVATETQVCYIPSLADVRRVAGVTGTAKRSDRPMSSTVTGNGGETGHMADPLSEPITLSEAIDEGLFTWGGKSAVKMRMARAREAGRKVPEPIAKRGRQAGLYKRGDLIEWAEAEMGATRT